MVWRPRIAYGTIFVLAPEKGKPEVSIPGWPCRGQGAWPTGMALETDEEWSGPRRMRSETNRSFLSDYNNLIARERGETIRLLAEFLGLDLWVRHRSGRRTSAWVSFSGATIPAPEVGGGRYPSRWNGSRHVADLR